jgi:hypothetical protein
MAVTIVKVLKEFQMPGIVGKAQNIQMLMFLTKNLVPTPYHTPYRVSCCPLYMASNFLR